MTDHIPREQMHWTLPSFKTRLLIYLFFFTFLTSLLFLRNYRHEDKTSDEWDLLIFSQNWPNTVCMSWEEKGPTNHTCHLPTERNIWTVHGIWPTKLGTTGPNFCNSSVHFNMTQLSSIQANMSEYWISVEMKGKDQFWRHEWKKHGTCASALPAFDSELKYFRTGLQWLQDYNMAVILEKGGVTPSVNGTTDLTSMWLGVKQAIGINPFFSCIHDKKTHQYYLLEIRICFDKSLKLIDCDGVRRGQGFSWEPLGNCPSDKPIVYPSIVPPLDRKPPPPPPDTSIVTLYKVIQFAMWITS